MAGNSETGNAFGNMALYRVLYRDMFSKHQPLHVVGSIAFSVFKKIDLIL